MGSTLNMDSGKDREVMNKICTNCSTTDESGQWWFLRNYYKISGLFCPSCYELVSHDSYGNPRYIKEYKTIAVKQHLIKPNVNL